MRKTTAMTDVAAKPAVVRCTEIEENIYMKSGEGELREELTILTDSLRDNRLDAFTARPNEALATTANARRK
jgi:hypothetical protein